MALETNAASHAPLPAHFARWHLHGAGLDALELVTLPLPVPGAGELLVRHDACGICYSDVKIVDLGPDHPRLQGRDMAREPVVMGHEVALTVVAVGSGLADRFQVGQRFALQPDAYFGGVGLTYGYQLPGGMAQYGLVTREVLGGDDGCYLLPLAPATGQAEAALAEPWACVDAAYAPSERRGLLDNGRALIVNINTSLYGDEVRGVYPPGHQPAEIVTVDNIPDTDFDVLRAQETGNRGFDDIVVYGTPTPDDLGRILTCLGDRGVLNLLQDRPLTGTVAVDIGRIHYERQRLVGAGSIGDALDAYTSNTRTDLRAGGAAWFVGAGGPLGQMHVQRALTRPLPPRTIAVSDTNPDRLARLRSRFAALADAQGVALHLIGPGEEGKTEQGGPFDDIVCLVPSAAVVEATLPCLAPNGVYNLFAGIAKGTLAHIDLGTVLAKNQRIIGTSGSSIADLRGVLERVEQGTLSTNASVAAIGGLGAFRDGLAAVREGRFAGKAVIFPQLPALPLLALSDLEAPLPSVHAQLGAGLLWTAAAEQELFRLLLP